MHWSLIALLMPLLVLTGCGDPLTSREDRINEAVPLGAQAQRSVEAVRALGATHPKQAQRIDYEVAFRLKIRARSCTHGYAPSIFSDNNDIRDALQDSACFRTADAELAQRLGMLWVGLTLSLPPLRPLPDGSMSHLEAEATLSNVRFAREAGVAAMDVQKGIQIVDMDSGQRLHFAPRNGSVGNDGALSPNGRLVAVHGPESSTRILDAASGELMLELPKLRADSFTWLDARTAYALSSAGDRGWMFDFAQGRPLPCEPASRALKVPDAEDQYVLFSKQSVARVQFVRIGVEAGVHVLLDRPHGELPGDAALAGVTADGRKAFWAQDQLFVTPLDTLETQRIELDPFKPTQVVATPDPDQIILMGAMTHEPDRPLQFLYRISAQKAAPIELGRLAPTRYLYIASLRRLGLMAGNRLSLGHSLPVGPELPLARVRALALVPPKPDMPAPAR